MNLLYDNSVITFSNFKEIFSEKIAAATASVSMDEPKKNSEKVIVSPE